ncbi:hypothetical protein [Longitalea luteola]|uniref:hypothetical protein n=1 Tax=Longitalea luteola TaxID=2812563 RepID=UPI001A978BA5|nr:hypothetical protein [Longitalea luteola]
MKLNQPVYIFRGLAICAITLVIVAVVQHRKNKQLTEHNNELLLLNDSVLSVNLQLQKDINFLKHDVDSLLHSHQPEKQQLTANK